MVAASPSASPECQTSIVRACVLNSVVKKTAHMWKNATEGETWDQRSPYFRWFSIGFKPSNLRSSQLWLTRTRLWRLTYKLAFSHTVHTAHCMTRKTASLGGEHGGLAEQAPCCWSASASHPLQLPRADGNCSPLLWQVGGCQATWWLKRGLNWWKYCFHICRQSRFAFQRYNTQNKTIKQ